MAGWMDRLKKSGKKEQKQRVQRAQESLKTRGPQPEKNRGFMGRMFDPVRPPKPKKK